MKPRSRWEIRLDILTVISKEKGAKKTRIMRRAFLDWQNFQRHFDFLLRHGYINNPEVKNCYYLTEKGRALMERIRAVDNIL